MREGPRNSWIPRSRTAEHTIYASRCAILVAVVGTPSSLNCNCSGVACCGAQPARYQGIAFLQMQSMLSLEVTVHANCSTFKQLEDDVGIMAERDVVEWWNNLTPDYPGLGTSWQLEKLRDERPRQCAAAKHLFSTQRVHLSV